MEVSLEIFESFPPKKKLEFLKSEEFQNMEEKGNYVLAALRESFPPLKAYAIKLAGEIGLKNEEFFTQFLSDPNPVVRDSVAKVLETMKKGKEEERNLREQVERILVSGEKKDKIELIEKLKDKEGKWVSDTLLNFIEDPSWEVRNHALRALREREDIDVQALLSLLKRPQWYIKSSVLELMGHKKLAMITQEILDLKRDSNIEVKMKLIEFLTIIGGEEVIEHLVELSKDSHSWVRKSAQNALNELKRTFISSIFFRKEQ